MHLVAPVSSLASVLLLLLLALSFLDDWPLGFSSPCLLPCTWLRCWPHCASGFCRHVCPLMFFLQLFPIFACCCLVTCWFLSLLSIVLGMPAYFAHLRLQMKSMRSVPDDLSACLRFCVFVDCFLFYRKSSIRMEHHLFLLNLAWPL